MKSPRLLLSFLIFLSNAFIACGPANKVFNKNNPAECPIFNGKYNRKVSRGNGSVADYSVDFVTLKNGDQVAYRLGGYGDFLLADGQTRRIEIAHSNVRLSCSSSGTLEVFAQEDGKSALNTKYNWLSETQIFVELLPTPKETDANGDSVGLYTKE